MSSIVEGDDEAIEIFKTSLWKSIERRVNFLNQTIALMQTQGIYDKTSLVEMLERLRALQIKGLESYKSAKEPTILGEFSEEVKQSLLDNIVAMELTDGCSNGCSFCGYGATIGVKKIMPAETASWFIVNATKVFELYFATDPLDHPEYFDFVILSAAKFGRIPWTSTAYPARGKDTFLKLGDFILQFSLTKANVRRLVRDGVFVQTAAGSLLPDAMELSESLLFGSLGVVRESYKGGNGGERFILKWNVFGTRSQILALDRDNGVAVKSGRNRMPGEQGDYFACSDGVVVRSDGLYNKVYLRSSDRYPNSFVDVNIGMDNLFDGTNKIIEIIARLGNSEKIFVEDVIKHGVVKAKQRILFQYNEFELHTFDGDNNLQKWVVKLDRDTGQILEIVEGEIK